MRDVKENRSIVALRVDGSRRIGGGHVMRCLTLATALRRRGFAPYFLTRPLDGAPIAKIVEAGFDVVELSAPEPDFTADPLDPPHAAWLETNWRADAEQCVARLGDLGRPRWLIVDHYALDRRWIEAVRSCADAVLVIDDVDDRDLAGDLLLNQSFIDRRPKRFGPERRLVGPHYALLRPEFAALRDASLRRRATGAAVPPRVLISTGLTDVGGAALKSTQALIDAPVEIDVALSRLAPTADALAALRSDRVRIHFDSVELGALMRDADLGVGAGGATSWERLVMGLPSIVFVLAENQAAIAADLDATGACSSLGRIETIDARAIRSAVAALLGAPERLAEMAARAAALCDGRGVDRVIEAMTAHDAQGVPA